MSKKILIVTECFYPEEFKINDVALAWKNQGYEVDVLTLVPTYPLGKVFPGFSNKLFQKDTYQGINVFRLHAVTGYRDSVTKKVLKYLEFMILGSVVAIFLGRKYDYVFGFNLGALTDMLPAVVIRKLYKKPVALWTQDIWPDSVYAYGLKKTKVLSTVLNAFVKFIYHNITTIAVSSKGFQSKLKPYVKKELAFDYAPNWADDLDMSVESAQLGDGQKTHFTFAGNIGKLQNLDNIINAFCLLSNAYQEKSQLNIVGDGSNLVNLQKIANNNSNIVFHGKQPRKDMAQFYKASDFLIVSLIDKPIFSVTVPAKIQTYISAKRPILAVIRGDTADIVNDNNLGICVDPSSVNRIKEAFESCIDMSEQERSEFVANNTKLLSTTFNKEHVIGQLTKQLVGR